MNRIHIGRNGNEAFSSRDNLLEKCKNGENKKRILRKQEKDIALSPLVDVTKNCLKDIHAELIDYQIDEILEGELGIIKNFIEYIISRNLHYEPWIIMDDEKIPPSFIHINDIKAYGFLLERLRLI